MRIKDIISLLKEYMLLGVIAVVFLGILFFIGYKVIYKKVMKGTKTITKKRMILYGITIGYAIIVLGAVFLNRGNIYGIKNLHLFSSYKEAYNKMQISLFRNNILNILLFVPLGFILPIYTDKLKKIYKVVPIGFLISLVIETIQYVSKIGIFEIDDILNNTIGVLIGYSTFMIFYSIIKKENRKCIIGYMLPTIIVVGVFLGIFIKYQNQELGNLDFEYNYKVNMKNIEIKNNIDLTKERINQAIYYKELLSEKETREIANNLFSKLGTSLDENDIDIYENTAIYYSQNREYNMWIKYKNGTYSYTDFSKFSHDKDKKIEEKSGMEREKIENALEKFDIKIPQNYIFEEVGKKYKFSINMEIKEDTLIDGELICSLYEDGTIKDIQNNLVQYKKVKEKEIISKEEAYQKILEGKFQYDIYGITKIQNIILEDVNIKYYIDSKGYFVPIYFFKGKINDKETEIKVKAIDD